MITAMTTAEFWLKLMLKWVDVHEGEQVVASDLLQTKNDVRTGKCYLSPSPFDVFPEQLIYTKEIIQLEGIYCNRLTIPFSSRSDTFFGQKRLALLEPSL